MKLHTKHSNIVRGGVHSETTFSIKTNALSFSILSSGLYTDPIMAIVRELSCNAYDAHTDANNSTTPFEIHLPNALEPFFSIKDFGTGLSEDDIQGEIVPITEEDGTVVNTRTGGLYTTYFDSTKTKSNDFIGALGLGSKSPFSYTNTFEVISRHGGTKSTYGIFLNEEGIPTVALMGKIETDEHSGLEIKLTIKKEDFHTFVSRTATALKYFKVQPTIKGVINFEFDRIPDKRVEADNWILSSASGYYNSSIVAVQGNVQYRVDSAQIKELLDSNLQTFISNSNIVLFFDIGMLEVAANREEIRYDKQSLEAIVASVKTVFKNLTSVIESRVGDVSTCYWDACADLYSLSFELFGSIIFLMDNVNVGKIKNPILMEYINNRGTVKIIPCYSYNKYLYKLTNSYTTTKTKRTSLGSSYSPDEQTAVIINDVKIGGIKRMVEYLENHNTYTKAILLTKRKELSAQQCQSNDILVKIRNRKGQAETRPAQEFSDLAAAERASVEELEQFTKALGNPKVLLLSEITVAPVKQIQCSTVGLSYYKYNGLQTINRKYKSTIKKCKWKKLSHNFDDGGIFIPLKLGKYPSIIGSDKKLQEINIQSHENINDVLKFLIAEYNKENETTYSYRSIFGLPARTCKFAEKSNDWVNLFDFATNLNLSTDFNEIIEFNCRSNVTNDYNIFKAPVQWFEFNEMVRGLPSKSPFKKAVLPYVEGIALYTTEQLETAVIVGIIEKVFCGAEADKAKPFFDESTFDKYEMFAMISEFGYNTNWDKIANYIKIIDRSK